MSTHNESRAAARWSRPSAAAAETGQGTAGRVLAASAKRLVRRAAAELKFEVAHITGERERFVHAVGAMGFNVVRAVLDLVENLPAEDPYTTLKSCLVLAH